MPSYDAIVVGLGAMGSSTAYQLARRGRSVLGLDRFTPPHDLGSSHGESRIIREAYWEHPSYVPLIDRAYELWDELGEAAGRPMWKKTGGLLMGVPDGEMIPGARRTAREFRLPHEEFDAADVRKRWPQFQPEDGWGAILEPRAGAVFPERVVQAHLDLARAHGAELRFQEPAATWRATTDGVEVETPKGVYRGDSLVLAAGAYVKPLLGELDLSLVVERQVLHWFEPPSGGPDFSADASPLFAFEDQPGKLWYGLPDLGTGVKVALHHQGEDTTPEEVDRSVREDDVSRVRRLVSDYIPDLDGDPTRGEVCLYTNAPDFHFVLDRHPDHGQVVICSPCSGHGFKYASVVGELTADLVDAEKPAYDLSLFSLDRLLG